MQLVPHRALDQLHSFIHRPCRESAAALKYVPAFRFLLLYEYRVTGQFTNDIIDIARWLFVQAHTTYDTLKTHEGPPEVPSTLPSESSWLEVYLVNSIQRKLDI